MSTFSLPHHTVQGIKCVLITKELHKKWLHGWEGPAFAAAMLEKRKEKEKKKKKTE